MSSSVTIKITGSSLLLLLLSIILLLLPADSEFVIQCGDIV
jgi:hypothetical protein